MQLTPEILKDLLVSTGLVFEEDFDIAFRDAQTNNQPLEDVLIEKGFITDKDFGRAVAEKYDYLFINLRKEKISEDVLKIIPEIVARNLRIIAFDRDKQGIKVAMADPENYEIIKLLEKKTGEKIKVYYTTPLNIRDSLRYYRKEIKEEFADIIRSNVNQVKQSGLKVRAEDMPIIKIVDTLIEYAYDNDSSDIHIEPTEEDTQVRFRIDGILHNVISLPKDIHNLVVTRIKVLSRLRTDEHAAAQDGKFRFKLPSKLSLQQEEKFDIRVSIVPVTNGEKVVMRLLSEKSRRYSLEELGFLEEDLKKMKKIIKKPYGMILSTGPTGSGKTTTLYAILKILNKPEVNITTIEDPVEYDMEGISQIQVNVKTGLTFATGLRSIVRQDPDIIMIGEIRDHETADIAINSAMTGHLVLSTMHANTAATNLIRLIDIGIEPFLVASSVNVVIGQRLVRTICEKCRYSYEAGRKNLEEMNLDKRTIDKIMGNKERVRLYRGKGCPVCNKTGYLGRLGIFELLEITEEIRKLIMGRADADVIEAQAIKNGMSAMLDDGIKKILLGITTIEEVIRVTRE